MTIFFCRKHGFCPLDGTLTRCLAQNSKQGCKNLIQLPTEHPKDPRYSRKKERRDARKRLQAIRYGG